jgi:hypothetical protein
LATDSGVSSTDHLTNTKVFHVTGLEATASGVSGFDHLEYQLDGVGTWIASTAGATDFTLAAGVTDGTHSVAVREIDVAGNTSTATTETFTLDTSAPTASVTTGTIPVLGANAHVVVQSSEQGTAYLVRDTDAQLVAHAPTTVSEITSYADNNWNFVAIPTENNSLSLPTSGLSDGSYHVYTADAAGNLSAESTNGVIVDGMAPSISSVVITGADSSGANIASVLNSINHDQILITLAMSEVVIVTGTPTYHINVGGDDKEATYISGSGTDSLHFSYAVSSTDVDTSGGITATASALHTDLGVTNYITDTAGNLVIASSPVVEVDANTVHVDSTMPSLTAGSISSFGLATNLDVTSNIVVAFDSAVTAKAGGHISLINDLNTTDSGKVGYLSESGVNSIDLYFKDSGTVVGGITTVTGYSDSTYATISGTVTINAAGVVAINPLSDLDLSNNYHLDISGGTFTKDSNGLSNAEIGANSSLHFSTVTAGVASPSGNIDVAASSSIWSADGTILAGGGHDWVSIEGVGNPSAPITIDASVIKAGTTAANYMFLVQNVATVSGELSLGAQTGISFSNFVVGKDTLYVDYQNNALPLPANLADATTGYVAGSGEGTGSVYQISPSSNQEGIVSYLKFLNLTNATVNQAVMFG